ncbi:MAG: 2-phospho-L-lactate transferase [Chloroflexi bacterium]|nr:2-phospho-L-lactate transferase [Chloroflexota bacterium]
MRVVALAGGVGGAKLADGLAQVLSRDELTIIVNTGDDFEHWGLKISPDLDTVCYTLAGLANPETGWGRIDESWAAFDAISRLGGADWFRIGDKDVATHIERTRRLQVGDKLSEITRDFCLAWGVDHPIFPMSDDPISTMVHTEIGVLPFQEYFVHQRCEPKVKDFLFAGAERSQPAEGVLDSIEGADLVVVCPSNPWVSIDPILALPTLRPALSKRAIIAISPIIGGKALKGPAAKMYTELGIQPSAYAVAQHYGDLLTGIVIDHVDKEFVSSIQALGVTPFVSNTIMKSRSDRQRLAEDVLQFGAELISDKIG